MGLSEKGQSDLYDQIGDGYATQRRSDPRIQDFLHSQLQGISTLLNVGAGHGSYEPDNLSVVAVEPSTKMISQRRNRSNVVQARAEALPFSDNSFEAATAILTIQHWHDKRKGLEECARVVQKRLVILTWDPDADSFWLQQDYFPELLATDRTIFPSMEALRKVLGNMSVCPLPIPADCTDGFLGAFWRRPDAYLEPEVRNGISSFSRIGGVAPGLKRLSTDLASGRWHQKYGHLLTADDLDVGYRLVMSEAH